jgi:hypothetical protein
MGQRAREVTIDAMPAMPTNSEIPDVLFIGVSLQQATPANVRFRRRRESPLTRDRDFLNGTPLSRRFPAVFV